MFAASLTVGFFLSLSSLSLSWAVISFFATSMSEAVPVPEITKYSLSWQTFCLFLFMTIWPPAVVFRSPAMIMPSLHTIPTRLVPVVKMFFFNSASILES